MKYLSTRIGDGVYHLVDEEACSFYVVEGEHTALVIDTGYGEGQSILPLIQTLTTKPVVFAATHSHLDHICHIDEFDTVYMSHRELEISCDFLELICGKRRDVIQNAIDVKTGSVIDLGGNSVEVFEVPGHSPGSVVYLEKKNGILFTGDAIGSGCGVWMQIPGALPLTEYHKSLTQFRKWLIQQDRPLLFYGGHNMQQFQSALIPGYNPLSLGLVCDLTDLVGKIITGEVVGRSANVDKTFSLEPTLYASFGRAEILYDKKSIMGYSE